MLSWGGLRHTLSVDTRNLVAVWEIVLVECHQPESRTDTTEDMSIHQVPVTVVRCIVVQECDEHSMYVEHCCFPGKIFPPTYQVQGTTALRTWYKVHCCTGTTSWCTTTGAGWTPIACNLQAPPISLYSSTFPHGSRSCVLL